MDKQVFTESNSPLRFSVKSIKEAIKAEIQKNGMMIVRKVPSTILNEKNANGRIYSSKTMGKSLDNAKSKGLFESRQLICTGDDHPDTTFPKPINSSHVVLDAYTEKVDGKNVLFNDWLILPTRAGKDLRALIEAGVSIGTSIRGLGRQEESTGEIVDYEFLGTDVVGNPSAGTFAPFEMVECVVEAVSEDLAKNITENLNITKSQEGTNMFILETAIAEFKAKHESVEITGAMITDILAIENQVDFENDSQVEMLESFKSEVLGEVAPVKEAQKPKNNKAEDSKDKDVINKYMRQLESSKVIIGHLKTQNEELLDRVQVLENYKESSNKLVSSLVNKAKTATDKLQVELSSIEDDKSALGEHYKKVATKIVEDLQAEAMEVIQEKEAQLEAAIQLGNIIGEHFLAMQAINECLIARIKSHSESEAKANEQEVLTTEAKATKKNKSNSSTYNRHMMSTWK